ncbi:MAG: hypothetical protein M3430_17455 [Acidobacteriota bacterium]|nr:hypothetical protein [Acidobacteriota bacterium]
MLFHRTSSAIEVIIFVIARKIVSPDASALDLILSVAALYALLVVRFTTCRQTEVKVLERDAATIARARE